MLPLASVLPPASSAAQGDRSLASPRQIFLGGARADSNNPRAQQREAAPGLLLCAAQRCGDGGAARVKWRYLYT